jgi:hypothetical protein
MPEHISDLFDIEQKEESFMRIPPGNWNPQSVREIGRYCDISLTLKGKLYFEIPAQKSTYIRYYSPDFKIYNFDDNYIFISDVEYASPGKAQFTLRMANNHNVIEFHPFINDRNVVWKFNEPLNNITSFEFIIKNECRYYLFGSAGCLVSSKDYFLCQI